MDKTRKPTQDQIDAEVAKLKEMKPHVRRFGGFGSDNHKAIEAQIDVLENDLTETQFLNKYFDEDDIDIYDSASDAFQWKMGVERDTEGDDGYAPPSYEWEFLT